MIHRKVVCTSKKLRVHGNHHVASMASDDDYSLTYSELGGSCRSLVETEHDNLQAVTAIGAFEEAWLQQVRGHRRRQVDPPICQAVAVERKQMKAAKAIRTARTDNSLILKRNQSHHLK